MGEKQKPPKEKDFVRGDGLNAHDDIFSGGALLGASNKNRYRVAKS